MITIQHQAFLTRSITRGEVLAYARSLGYPRASYRDGRIVLESETDWKHAGMSMAADRRELYRQLVAVEHAGQTQKHRDKRGKVNHDRI